MTRKKICVAGVTGLVGANLTKKALSKGYFVNGTTRDASNTNKTKYLRKFTNNEKLVIYEADMSNSKSFDKALSGVDALFITCLVPIYKTTDGIPANQLSKEEGKSNIIAPTVNGCLNILQAAKRCNIKTVIICSSTASTNPDIPVEIKNEVEHWSNELTQIETKKYTSAAKTIMEKRAIEFCKENKMRLCIFLPTGLYGELLMPSHLEHNPYNWLYRLMNGGEPRHKICPNDSISMIHTEDLAELFLAALEDSRKEGRFFGVYQSLHWHDIYLECKKYIPDMRSPDFSQPMSAKVTNFDFSRRDSLGIKLRNFPQMIAQTVEGLQRYKDGKL